MLALAVLCTAQFMVVLDVTIVAVALPAIQADLGFGTESLQWVVTAYTLVFGGFLVLAGRAGDLYGRRRLFAIGLALFAGASLACGLAPSAAALVALRAVQGLGAAIVAPTGLALLTATFGPGAARRRAVAAWTAAAAGGGAAGWVLGGVLSEVAGWEWIFLVNAPVGLAAAAIASRALRESRDPAPRGLDAPGALTLTVGIAALVLGVERGIWPALLAAAALLAAFAAIERRSPDPLVPPGVLRVRPFATATGAALAITAATTPPMFLAVLHLQRSLGLSAVETGLACAPVNLAVIGGAALAPRVVARAGAGRAMSGGLLTIAVGAVLLAASGELAPMLVAFVVLGSGLGCASVASTAAGTSALPPEQRGLAAGMLNAAAQIGTVLGLGALVSVAAAGYAWAFAGAALIALAAAAAARRNPHTPRCAA
ncbi:MAG TPA: MFS transporter [Solirubrobacteraceae bacterium]|nr:MFS transporter [Solirubrobacteraceae bacterium]